MKCIHIRNKYLSSPVLWRTPEHRKALSRQDVLVPPVLCEGWNDLLQLCFPSFHQQVLMR